MRAITGSTRTIWIMAAVAVVSLGAGLGLSQLIVSPSEAAANAAAPEAGPITVPVERRTLANDIIMRGDAVYEDPVSVMIETGDIGGAAVVTGQVPEVGATLDAGKVILEVVGRPVILLPGELPVYRTLRSGMSGPDVTQLKAALRALGIDPGNDTNTYDSNTAAAVRELYSRVGYPIPSSGEEADAALEAAQGAVRTAEEGLASAQRALATGGQTSYAARVEAQAAVDAAQAALNDANTTYAECIAAADPATPCPTEPVATAQGALASAIARRDEANAPPDTAELRAAVTSAQRALGDAQEDYAKAQKAVVTPMPASEVVYLTNTPRRVDAVNVKRGAMLSGTAAMSVSGATLQIAGNVSKTDADLLTEGAPVVITLPDNTEVPGTVQSVGTPDPKATEAPDPNRKRVVVVPGELTEEQRAQLQGANVRVEIPVSSTEGEVLAVPIAAITAGPGGESRVEVLDEGAEDTRLVTVELGLAAEGFVEITPIEGSLEEGDRVVVSATEPAESDDETSDEGTPDESETPDETTDGEPGSADESATPEETTSEDEPTTAATPGDEG
jgi:multidrug efflux pump subunit AcrA (membrane-fusion protein)